MRKESIRSVMDQFESLLARGNVEVSRVFKLQRLAVTRFISGRPLLIEGIRQDKVLLPVVLPRGLRDRIEAGCPWSVRWSLTLLTLSRAILGGTPVDFETITKPSNFSNNSISDYEIARFWQSLARPKLSHQWTKYHWSVKAGPNGPGLQGALADLVMLKDSPILESLKHFYKPDAPLWRLLTSIDQPRFQLLLSYFRVSPKRLRKLSIKNDREAKSRVFAILDYWSQSALRPLHDGVFSILRRLPGDCTYDQGRLLDDFANTKTNQSFHSLDLTAATDRFPIEIQWRLLRLLVGESVATAWKELMVQEPFAHKGSSYKYSAGQPMGAYSSWPIFTLSHHMIIFIAALRAGLSQRQAKRCYMILGDDIVIRHDETARQYREILKSLDVEINEAKTHISKDTFEFAKRWYYKGLEVSPWPIHALVSSLTHWPQLIELLDNEVVKRGYGQILYRKENLDTFGLLYERKRLGQQIQKRLQLYTRLPCFHLEDSGTASQEVSRLWSMVESTEKFLPEDALGFITKAANVLVRKELGKGISSVSRHLDNIFSYYEKLDLMRDGQTPCSSSLSPDSFSLMDVPLIKVFTDLADPELQELGSVPIGKNLTEWFEFWKAWKKLDIIQVPEFNGIIPLRKRDTKAATQSHLGLELIRWLTSKSFTDIEAEIELFNNPPRRKRKPRVVQ